MFNNKCCLFIGNISENCSPADIHKAFAPFGKFLPLNLKIIFKNYKRLFQGMLLILLLRWIQKLGATYRMDSSNIIIPGQLIAP